MPSIDETSQRTGANGRGADPDLTSISDGWLRFEVQQWRNALQGWADTIPYHRTEIESLEARIAELQANIDDTTPRVEAAEADLAVRAEWDKANPEGDVPPSMDLSGVDTKDLITALTRRGLLDQ